MEFLLEKRFFSRKNSRQIISCFCVEVFEERIYAQNLENIKCNKAKKLGVDREKRDIFSSFECKINKWAHFHTEMNSILKNRGLERTSE